MDSALGKYGGPVLKILIMGHDSIWYVLYKYLAIFKLGKTSIPCKNKIKTK
jgi:hypothetical protein